MCAATVRRPSTTGVSVSRALHLLTLLLVLLVPAALLGACGGDDSSGEDVNTVLQETFDGTGKKVESGKLDLSLKLDLDGAGRGLDDPIAISLSGPFENQGEGKVPRFDFNLNLDGGGQQFQAGAVSTGSAAYVTVADQAYKVDDATYKEFQEGYVKAQEESGQKESGPSLQALGVDPRRWLEDPEEVGTEEVGGAETIHLTAKVDVPALLEDVNRLVKAAGNLGVAREQVPDELTPAERARAAEALKSVKVDIWTGKDDKTLRRISLSLEIEVPENERKKAGLAGGKVELEYAIGDLNQPQKIEEPGNARPISDLNTALQSLGLGGGSGGSGSGGGSATTPQGSSAAPQGTSTTASPSQEYLTCLEEAGEDAAKVSECSKLLTQP
jgi:hypothetical protein